MVQEWRTLGERVLSGKGTFRIPIEDFASLRAISIFIDVTRKPQSDYLSDKYEPKRSFYGYLTFLTDDYVLREYAINYTKQRIDFYNDLPGIIQKQLPCVNQEILQSIANLGVALGAIPISIQNETKDWNLLNFAPKVIQFRMYSSSLVRVLVKGIDYDDCEEIEEESEQKEPPPPDPPVFYEPGEPAEISDAYDDDTENQHDPFPGDAPPEPEPPPRTCEVISVGSIRIQGVTTFGTPFNQVVETFGVFGGTDGALILVNPTTVAVMAYGSTFLTTVCSETLIESVIYGAPANYIIDSVSYA